MAFIRFHSIHQETDDIHARLSLHTEIGWGKNVTSTIHKVMSKTRRSVLCNYGNYTLSPSMRGNVKKFVG